jgi:hypothetical protein
MLLQSCGCSLIGFTVGAIIDGGKPKESSYQLRDLIEENINKNIKVVKVDSTTAEGKYLGNKKYISSDSETMDIMLEVKDNDKKDTVLVPTNQIAEVKILQSHSLKSTFLIIGLVVDAAVAAIYLGFILMMSQFGNEHGY